MASEIIIPQDILELKSFLQFMYIDTWNEGSNVSNNDKFMTEILKIEEDVSTYHSITDESKEKILRNSHSVIIIELNTDYNTNKGKPDGHSFVL